MNKEASWDNVEKRFRKEYPGAARVFDEFGAREGASGFLWQCVRSLHDWAYANVKKKDPQKDIRYTEVNLDDVKVLTPESMEAQAAEINQAVEESIGNA